jgi:RIO kinase 1
MHDDHVDDLDPSSDSFARNRRPTPTTWDDDEAGPETTEYSEADEHGPEPVPGWVITSGSATDERVGRLKSGKEADVELLERRFGDRVNLLAAKRYRDNRHRSFRNDAAYRVGKGPRAGREARAMANGTDFGMRARAGMWAAAEMRTLSRLYTAGVSVPYPVQRAGTELLLELAGDDDGVAPRLADARPSRAELAALLEQAVTLLRDMTLAGVVHADLSPYNLLVWGDRLVAIDFPQAVDLTDNERSEAYNPATMDFLYRDVTNVLGWFARKGAACDPEAVFGDLVASTVGNPYWRA